ncbi:MAG TPA: response regulator [Methylomirabilota bacterium]|jgi:DNA-binding response OmpR family regulator
MHDPLKGRRILIVDDHADTLDMLSQACESQLAEAVSASSAREALTLAASARPDALITDIGLRGEDGVWLLQEVRRLHPTLPVIALTGRSPEDALAAGFDAVLLKPTDPWQLCDELRRVLRERTTAG